MEQLYYRCTDELADKNSHKDAHRRTDYVTHRCTDKCSYPCDMRFLPGCQQRSEQSKICKECLVHERQDLPARTDD